jgi:diguanylate cyclase (GGDEF)-like protein/PAS domain S-box-containing protein
MPRLGFGNQYPFVLEAPLFDSQSPVRQLTHVFEALSDALVLRDGEGRWLLANAPARELFQLKGRGWQGKTNQELAAGRPRMRALHEQCFGDDEGTWVAGKVCASEIGITDASGQRRDYELRKAPLFSGRGVRRGMFVMARDITSSKRAEQDLRVADAVIESQQGLMITNARGVILRVNRAFTRLTGYETDEVIGQTPALLQSGRHDKAFYRAMWRTLLHEKSWQGEIWDRHKSGEIYPKWLTITAVAGPGGEITRYVGAFADLSEHKAADETIHRLAFYDFLTELPNRRLLCEHLHRALSCSARERQHGAILQADVDNFKSINDTQGHAIGDQLLVEVARRVKSCLCQGDILARMGGDEFAILLGDLDADAGRTAVLAKFVAGKILEAVRQPYVLAGQSHHASISIGISLFGEQDARVEDVLMRADAAMYQAKTAGRNTVCFFNPELQAQLQLRVTLESELRLALANDQLKLYYQAQVNHARQVLGAEVLLRWAHPKRGLVPPAEFIPIAEDSGLILPIGEWVLRTACDQLKAWEAHALTRDFLLAVNVSARQFRQPDFVAQVLLVLEQTGANAARLKLELTESLVLHNVADTIQKMEALRLHGIRFSLDDFGTGYSSLAHLNRLPLDQLKIDQSFVRQIGISQSDTTIVQTIIGMAHSLGLNVIAEGVETEAQRACLERYHCPVYQGYLFGKPMPLLEFESLVSQAQQTPVHAD